MSDLMVVAELKCKSCGKKVSGGLDTYGAIGKEQCYSCFLDEIPLIDTSPKETLWDLISEIATLNREGRESELGTYINSLKKFVNVYPEFKKYKKVQRYL